MTPARERAFRMVAELCAGRRPPAADDEAAAGDSREGRLAAEIAHGVARHLSRLDFVIARCAGRPVSRIAPPALTAARIGVFQLLFLPSVPPYAAVSESVALARAHAPRAAGFVNWILRRVGPEEAAPPARGEFPDEVAWLSTLHSFPPWLVRRWLERLGPEETAALLAAMNEHPPPHLRVNRLAAGRERLREALAAEGFEVSAGRHCPDALRARGPERLTASPLFAAGAFYLQDESAQLPALLLAPARGERILDACAGVGGKTTQIAELAGGGAEILALDRDGRRLARLGENARRLGVAAGITALRGDLLDRRLLAGRTFDAVLLDAPCSALGTIPRHPEVRWAKRPSDPARLSRLQRRLLERAAELVVPGGRIVFSTCTTEPEEGEQVVREVLEAHPELRIEAPPQGALGDVDRLLTPEGFLRTWPHRHGIGGSFAALLRRRA